MPSTPNTTFSLTTGPESKTRPIDDCFVTEQTPSKIPLDTHPEPPHTLAILHSDASGLNLRVESTEPAFQIYTGGFIDVPAWKAGEADGEKWEGGEGYKAGSAVCVEPSRYVNAAGQKEWRSMALLKKGGVFGTRSRYWGWKD